MSILELFTEKHSEEITSRNGKWRLSPAYDVKNKWLSAHQMTVNGKKSDINLMDLLETGEKMGLKKRKCMDIIFKISLVVSNFEKYANEANIRENTYMNIKEILNQNKVEV